jgi:hypothetical protein
MNPQRLRELAVRGAAARLVELEAEIAAIRKAFPELKRRRPTLATTAARSAGGRKKKTANANGKALATRAARRSSPD